MSNIRLFFLKALSDDMTDKLDKSQSHYLTKVMRVKKNEVAFLSANTWDVSGGGNYGYQSIWVNRNKNIFDNLDYKPRLEIKNLKDLLPNI